MPTKLPRILARAARATASAWGLAAIMLAMLAGPALASGTVTPTVDCAVNNGDGTFTAYFGYQNTGANSVTIAVGDNNEFVPGDPNQGQPTIFNVGSYPEVTAVTFDPNIATSVSWVLNGLLATASASTTPCVAGSTGPASGLSLTSATVTGVIDPRGEATSYHFDYGTTSAYGQSTSTQSSSSDDPSVGSATLTGLNPGTTYHYRLVAGNPIVGTTDGQDATFTTPAPPVTPTPGAMAVTEPASDVTSASASLNGVINPQSQATSYQFQWGTTTAYGQTTPAGSLSGADPQPVSAVLTGLSPATTYHYRLIATGSGTSTDGADGTFTTPAAAAPTTADLILTAHTAPKNGVRGRSLTYVFKLDDRGPATATSVLFRDLLPPGLSAIRISAPGGSCSSRHGPVCRFGALASGASATISVTVRANRTGALREIALAVASQPDPNLDNNFAGLLTTFSAPRSHRP